jgi:outer membrane protein insertion porin family
MRMGNKETKGRNGDQGSALPVVLSILLLFACFLLPVSLHSSNDNPPDTAGTYSNSPGPERGLFNKTIKAIDVRGLTRIGEEELIDLVCFKIGDILDRNILASGIRRAFKKGIFLDIKVESEPYMDGIRLIYAVREISVIENITITGNKHLSSGKIKKIFFFEEDEDFRAEFLDRARTGLADHYKRKGFPDASVSINLEKGDTPSSVNLLVNIEEGPPLVIKSIEIPDDVKKYLRLSVGDILDTEVLEKDINKIRDHYKKEKYIMPAVGPYEFRDGDLRVPVVRGRELELLFKGNSVISKRKLEKAVPFYDDEEVLDDSIEETVKQIRKLYLSKGYYYARVAAGVESEGDKIRVSFFIVEGKEVVLRNIGFTGISISREAVMGIIPFKENKPYNANLLKSSRESLISFYKALGYLNVGVTDIKKTFRNDGRDLDIEYIINEGTQTIIRQIKITGSKSISESKIKRTLGLHVGNPYNVIDIGDARIRLLSLYSQYGYVDASVEIDSIINKDKAVLTFRITENKPAVVGKIILKGNRKTKAKIIRREFTIDEGEPYNFEELLKTKQMLYKLGLFNEVSIEMLESGQEADGKLVKDVIVSIREGKAGSVEFGLGYGDYEGVRGSFDVRYINLGGYNRQVGFKAEVSSVEQRYIFNFKEPWLFNKPDIPFNVFLTKEEIRSVNLDTEDVLYEIDRISLLVDVEMELSKRLRANFNYEYSFTDTTDVDPDVILSREDTGTIGIGSISPSLFYDTRDDPFEPSSGSLHGITLKFASEAFLSETEFVKGTFQSSWFFKLRRGLILAFAFKGGAAYSFEDNEELPLIERFFLGGRTTVRGYSQDMLGPKGPDGNPTGGNIFSLINTELRIALGKGFGLVAFVDSGNVWVLAEDTDEEHKYTAGGGLRYSTPVGPLRIDYGHKLDREGDESSGEFHFSFGHAF